MRPFLTSPSQTNKQTNKQTISPFPQRPPRPPRPAPSPSAPWRARRGGGCRTAGRRTCKARPRGRRPLGSSARGRGLYFVLISGVQLEWVRGCVCRTEVLGVGVDKRSIVRSTRLDSTRPRLLSVCPSVLQANNPPAMPEKKAECVSFTSRLSTSTSVRFPPTCPVHRFG